MAKAHVPREIIDNASGGFATKPALARVMIERAIAARVPFSFVAANTVYGVGDIEMALRRKRCCAHTFHVASGSASLIS